MRRSLVFVCCLLLTINMQANSKTLKSVEEARKLSQRISELFYKDSISAAFKEIKVYWPLEEDEIDELKDKTIKSLNIVDNIYGYKIGPVKISEETILDFAFKETYILRYEKSALKLIFKYYNSGYGWIVNGFKWDDEYSTEFK
jgi:hypothetical protein